MAPQALSVKGGSGRSNRMTTLGAIASEELGIEKADFIAVSTNAAQNKHRCQYECHWE
jgi:hypothetical protein